MKHVDDEEIGIKAFIDRLCQQRFMILIAASLLIFAIASTFAWQAFNRNDFSDGMNLGTDDLKPEISFRLVYPGEPETYSSWELIDWNWNSLSESDQENVDTIKLISLPLYPGKDMRPGDSAVFELKVVNKGNKTISVDSLGFLNPEEGFGKESPMHNVKIDQDVFLGTQLFAKLDSINGSPYSDTSHYLASLDSEGELVVDSIVLYSTSESSMVDGSSNPPIALANEDEILFRFSITFENIDVPQNEYKHFGQEGFGGECSRCLFVECNSYDA